MGDLLLAGHGRLTSSAHRSQEIELIDGAQATGAELVSACGEIGNCLRTLKRWRRKFARDGDDIDRRQGSHTYIAHRLNKLKSECILVTCNQPLYAALQPGQIVPDLADQWILIGSECSFYRVLRDHGQVHRRGKARPPQEPRPVPRLAPAAPNQMWNWDITYLLTTVRGI